MIIQHNQSALNAWRNTKTNNGNTSKSLEKLSSGLKVNRSADDAASLAISEKMRGQIRGLSQAQKNLKDGISLVKTADGALQEGHAILQRIRELLVQASNATYEEDDRQMIQAEIDHLLEGLNQLSYNTKFNDIRVLRNSYRGFPNWVVMDINPDGTLVGTMVKGNYVAHGNSYTAARIDFSDLTGYNAEELVDSGFSFTCCTCSRAVYLRFNDRGDNSFTVDTSLPDGVSTLNVDITGVSTSEELLERIMREANKVMPPLDPSSTSNGFYTHFTRFAMDPDDPNVLIAYDIRPNQTPNTTPGSVRADAIVLTGEPFIKIQAGANQGENIDIPIKTVDVYSLELRIKHGSNEILADSPATANKAVELVDNAINIISEIRADFGSSQNRMEHALNNVGVQAENLQSAESTIRDVDMAKEMMEFVKNNILVQASQSMLAQANQLPQGVVGLLT